MVIEGARFIRSILLFTYDSSISENSLKGMLAPELLRTVEVFKELTDIEREDLARLATRRVLSKGEILCYQEDHWPYVIYIASGGLRSSINSPDGRTYVVSAWGKGEVFWAHTVFDQDPMPSTLTTAQSTTIYQWDGEQALQIVFRNHSAVGALLRRQTQLIRRRRESIYNLAFNPVASRLAKLVVEKFMASEEPTVQRDLTLGDRRRLQRAFEAAAPGVQFQRPVECPECGLSFEAVTDVSDFFGLS